MGEKVEIEGYKNIIIRDEKPRIAFILKDPILENGELDLDHTIGCYIENGKLIVVGAWKAIIIEPDSANKARISLKNE